MKKAMKIILPILLAIAVIGCMIWYLFVYDRTFTRDLLLHEARQMETNGRHKIASWFYDRAYDYADHADEVAIELALQYKLSGNYTKAEFTLSNAISDEPSAALYTALCKTYVEQDKLLDAVTMLDHITDPEIKSQLDAARPSAPVFAPESGFYTQYIAVEVESDSGSLFVNADGEYPSIETDLYTGPITLEAGETTIYAVAVSDAGLVSPLTVSGYTVGGVVEDVVFTDDAIEAEIRNILGVTANTPLLTSDLWQITEFTVPAEASYYDDLGYLTYLHTLTMENADGGQLSFIADLTDLETLTITGSYLNGENVAMIAGLPALKHLTLSDCSLSTIEDLAAAQNLVSLDLSQNTIRHVSALSGMTKLEKLNLAHNAMDDLSDLSALSSLQKLDISYNSVSSLAPISSLKNLTSLEAGSNAIASLGEINNLTGLKHLGMGGNQLTDVSLLADATGITDLDISNNSIQDISSLASLSRLVKFNFSHNQVKALPNWDEMPELITIDGSYNQLTNLDVLAGMPKLNNVLMDYNEELKSVSVLADCPQLVEVNIFGTKVLNASDLTKLGIIVNYDPTQLYQDHLDELN